MKRLAIALVMLPAVAVAQPPRIEFKGIPLGATREELLANMADFKCTGDSCSIFPDLLSRRQCVRAPSRIKCAEQIRLTTSFGPAPVDSWTVKLREDRVAMARVAVGEKWFPQVVIALTEKYGQPTSDTRGTVQNSAGASFENRAVRWELPDGTIRGEQRGADVNTATFVMVVPGEDKRQEQEMVDKAKASAKRL